MSVNSIYRNFAENLRILATAKGSIADTCRALEINRQQFNKYLAGTGLPSKEILERIADYFKIEETALVQDPTSMRRARRNDDFDPIGEILNAPKELQRSVGEVLYRNQNTALKEGCYEIFYPWQVDKTLIVRAVVVVFKANDVLYFKRYTRLKGVRSSVKVYPAGCHSGIVINDGRGMYMLGRNERGYGEISLLSFGESQLSNFDTWFGLALIMTPWSESKALRCTLVYRGDKTNFRRLLRGASMGPVGADSIETDIYESVVNPLPSTIPQMNCYQPLHRLINSVSF